MPAREVVVTRRAPGGRCGASFGCPVPSLLRSPSSGTDLKRALKGGFTLIELLVVIAIIAILAAILFPLFARAKAAAKGATSLSNLRQIGTAWTLYASDADGIYMPPRSWLGARRYAYWWASVDDATATRDDSGGLLHPYTRGVGVQSDPLFPSTLRTALGLTGYGYNYRYLGSGAVSDTAAADPAGTVAFASSARMSFIDRRTVEGNTYLEAPSAQYPTFHARANGVGPILWVDGHAKTRRPMLRDRPFAAFSPEPFRTALLGEIDGDGDLTTNDLFDLN